MTEPADPRPPQQHLRAVPNDDHNRQPPQDIPAEQAVIGAILNDPTTAIPAIASAMAPEDFWQPRHELIYRAAIQLHAANQPVDPITVTSQLLRNGTLDKGGGAAYIHTLHAETFTAANAAHHAGIVHERAILRRLIAHGTAITQLGYSGTGTDQAITDRLTTALTWITDALDDTPADSGTDPRLIPGGTFLLDDTETIDSIWGQHDDVLWMRGESLLIAGPSGVGKTTLGQQVVLARIGVRNPAVLGYPCAPAGRCLYFAMDRPMQAKRSLRRMISPDHHHLLNERLTVWKGPPPQQVVANPRVLLELAERAGLAPGDFVVVDSVKDVGIGIASDEVGAAVNIALQELLAADIDVLALHHVRKRAGDAIQREPESLDDLYGSSHITNGAGSVFSIWGLAGDPLVKFKHLKQPAEPVGPFELLHDHVAGVTTIDHGIDIVELVKWQRESGLSAAAAAVSLFRVEDREPEKAEVERARRKLDGLVRQGLLVRREAPTAGRGGRGQATRWFIAAHPSSGQEAG